MPSRNPTPQRQTRTILCRELEAIKKAGQGINLHFLPNPSYTDSPQEVVSIKQSHFLSDLLLLGLGSLTFRGRNSALSVIASNYCITVWKCDAFEDTGTSQCCVTSVGRYLAAGSSLKFSLKRICVVSCIVLQSTADTVILFHQFKQIL